MTTESIKFIKLISGEELMGEVLRKEDDHYVMKNTILVNLIPNEDGRIGVQMVPFPFLVGEGDEIKILSSAISIEGNPSDDFLNSYNEKYGHIQVVKNPGIML